MASLNTGHVLGSNEARPQDSLVMRLALGVSGGPAESTTEVVVLNPSFAFCKSEPSESCTIESSFGFVCFTSIVEDASLANAM